MNGPPPVRKQEDNPRYRVIGSVLDKDAKPGPYNWGEARLVGNPQASISFAEATELVRRANTLPAVQAQLAEAVELLRACRTCLEVSGNGNRYEALVRTRAFLAKVDAP